MASLQLNCKSSSIHGPCALKIFGQVYRRSGPMLTKEEEVQTCLQTYFFDPEMQAKFRTDRFISEKDTITNFDLIYSKICMIFCINVKTLIFVTFSVLINSFKTIIWIQKKSDLKLIRMVNRKMICVIQVDFIYHLLWLKLHCSDQMPLSNKEKEKLFVGYTIQVQKNQLFVFFWYTSFIWSFGLSIVFSLWNWWMELLYEVIEFGK